MLTLGTIDQVIWSELKAMQEAGTVSGFGSSRCSDNRTVKVMVQTAKRKAIFTLTVAPTATKDVLRATLRDAVSMQLRPITDTIWG